MSMNLKEWKIIAGLVAEVATKISDVYHIDRGYYKLVYKLNKLGAYIWSGEDKFQVCRS